jgi:predicted unusual protein kinase regulating ubiquinone biosynthesis (AarF/ABC1/UbiB family)
MLRSRYLRILWFFGRIILNVIWWDIFLSRLGLRNWVRRNRPTRLRKFASHFRVVAVQMGGVMIKVGQFLSARLDVLPREITDELAGLQDEVRPESFSDIRRVVENEFTVPLEELFVDFNPEPLAAASIGQVHLAKLSTTSGDLGKDVVVKIQRPNIESIVATDLNALRIVSRWIHLYPPIRRSINIPALMEEFSKTLGEEIDYLSEGRNAETFAANFSDQPGIRVPRVHWNTTSRRVLTLEHIQAIKITDYSSIEAAELDRSAIASRLFNTYLKQIFEDRFFHADPHPGNLFVLPAQGDLSQDEWQLVFVDFGMTGHLTERLLGGLREALIAIGTQDAARLIRAYQQLDVLLPGADIELIQKASAEAFSRFWGRTAPELVALGHEEFASFAREFGEILYEMPFQIPENFILLGRCVSILSGICSGLDPNFNLWEQIVPYATKLIEAQQGNGVEGYLKIALREAGDWLRLAVSLPHRTEELINRLEQGKLSVQIPEVRNQLARHAVYLRRQTSAVLFLAFFLGGIQFYLAKSPELAFAAAILAFFTFIFTILGR